MRHIGLKIERQLPLKITVKIGYARVSTQEQHLDLQLDALHQAGCEKIYQEQVRGGLRKWRAARRGAALRALDMQLRIG